MRTLSSKLIASRLLVEEKSYDPEVEMDISSYFGGVQPLNLPPKDDTEGHAMVMNLAKRAISVFSSPVRI